MSGGLNFPIESKWRQCRRSILLRCGPIAPVLGLPRTKESSRFHVSFRNATWNTRISFLGDPRNEEDWCDRLLVWVAVPRSAKPDGIAVVCVFNQSKGKKGHFGANVKSGNAVAWLCGALWSSQTQLKVLSLHMPGANNGYVSVPC